MTKTRLEVKVAKILSREGVVWRDDKYRNERLIECKDPRYPLTDQEKNTLALYFRMIKFPMKIVFR